MAVSVFKRLPYFAPVIAVLKVLDKTSGHPADYGMCNSEIEVLVDPVTWLWFERICVHDDRGYYPDIKLFYGDEAGRFEIPVPAAPIITLLQCSYCGSDNSGRYGEGRILVRLRAMKAHVIEGFTPDKFLPKLAMWGHRSTEQRWTR